ncbi:MAG: hypothetical protein K5925_05090 [Bacilli bacterium]|nr:hypothetical protein [Bacilli bacterium]
MSEIKKNKISPRLENIVKGTFYVLFAIVLALNVGKVARTLAFVPLYLFGASYYFLCLLLVIKGVYRIVAGQKLKFHTIIPRLGIAVTFIGLVFLMGGIMMKVNNIPFNTPLADMVANYNGQLATYYQDTIINTFTTGNYWGGGLIYILLAGLIANEAAVFALAIILVLLGVGLLLIRPIIHLVRAIRSGNEVSLAKRRVKRIQEAEKEEEKEEEVEIVPLENEPDEITNDNFRVQYGFEPEDPTFSEHDGDYNQDATLSLDEAYVKQVLPVENSEFTPLVFGKTDMPAETKVMPSEFERQQVNNTYQQVEEPVKEEVQEQPVEEEVTSLDDFYSNGPIQTGEELEVEEVNYNKPQEVSKPQLDEELIRQQPVFEEPVVRQPVQPQPVPEVKKKKERVVWIPPSPSLLDTYETSEATEKNARAAEERMVAINQVLNDFGVGARCTSYTIGSSVTRFNIEYDANVSVSKVEKLVDDISLRLGGVNARFTAIVQGETFSGLEIPNVTITTVGFKEVFEALPDVNKHMLSVGFGKNISGNVVAADFDEFPHLLVAGTTGSGKSIYIHSIIATLIMRVSPDDLKIVLVDPKKVEMTKYRDMPHLLCPIITEAAKAKVMMSKLADEMNDRYEKFAIADSCSNIKQYNEWAREHNEETMPYIIAVLDEYADLVDTCKEISQPVVSIAQKARAAGIHMLISTQRPSTNVITGVIKGNLPTHVALMTSSYTDSMTILGEGGAEKLLGKGDMLVQSPLVSRVGLTRLQGCYIQNREISRIVGYLKEHYETVYDENYLDLVDHSKEVGTQMVTSGEVEKEKDAAEEEKYQSIKAWVMTQQFVSMSKIQRECAVGFNRAGKFFSRLQKEGIVSTIQDGATKGCKVLVHGDGDDGSDYIVTSDELIG